MRITRASLLTKILILGLLVIVVTALLSFSNKLEQAQSQRDDIARQVAAQTQINADLADAIEHSDDPERIADVARDRLGLVAPGEIIFYGMGD